MNEIPLLQKLDLTNRSLEYHSWLLHPVAISFFVIFGGVIGILLVVWVRKRFFIPKPQSYLDGLRSRLKFLEQYGTVAQGVDGAACVCLTDIVKGYIAYQVGDPVVTSLTDEQLVRYVVANNVVDRLEENFVVQLESMIEQVGNIKYAGGQLPIEQFSEYVKIVGAAIDHSFDKFKNSISQK